MNSTDMQTIQQRPSVWIWPRTQMSEASSNGYKFVEEFFDRYYAPFRTLYFCRGRVAITAILEAVGASRNDLVFIQPFSSYCVQSAVSRVATPLTIHPEESKYQIVYHNFGKKAVADKTIFKKIIIEDSVDSLITSNDEEELFPNGGDYSVFSLAKLIHVPFGSIVVCRTDEAYERLKSTPIRQLTSFGEQFIVKQEYTDCVLLNNSTMISSVLNADVLKTMFEETITAIQHNVKAISEFTGVDFTNSKRLPSNVFSSKNFPADLYEKYNVEVKERHIYNYEDRKCLNVHMFPVHVDINL